MFKRLLSTLLLMLVAPTLFAVGTWTYEVRNYPDGVVLTINWTGDAADGTVPDFPVPISGPTWKYLTYIQTDPGVPAPTDNYDITVVNALGVDLLDGNGLNRDLTNTELAFPDTMSKLADSQLTVKWANQTDVSATGIIKLYFTLDPVSFGGGTTGGGGAVTIADGDDSALGTTTDAKNAATDGTSVTGISLFKQISEYLKNIEADTSTVPVNILPSADSAISPLTHYLTSAATTNSTLVKNAAGNVYGFRLINTTSTIYYLRMYNSSVAPTCSSATGFIESIPVPHATGTGSGYTAMQPFGQGYSTGIGYCLTGGGGSTDNTAAATGVYITILYK